MNPLTLYNAYRSLGLTRRMSFDLSGLRAAVLPTLQYLTVVAFAVLLWLFASGVYAAAEDRVAGRLDESTAEIAALRKIVAACLGDREGALYLDGELHLCRAVPTGVMK